LEYHQSADLLRRRREGDRNGTHGTHAEDRSAGDSHGFDFGDRTYQIDPTKQKVYRRFVEIESAKAFEILTTWRSRHATA
jgi:hypothetical protein